MFVGVELGHLCLEMTPHPFPLPRKKDISVMFTQLVYFRGKSEALSTSKQISDLKIQTRAPFRQGEMENLSNLDTKASGRETVPRRENISGKIMLSSSS